MKLNKYLRIKYAQKLDYDPDEAQALVAQSYGQQPSDELAKYSDRDLYNDLYFLGMRDGLNGALVNQLDTNLANQGKLMDTTLKGRRALTGVGTLAGAMVGGMSSLGNMGGASNEMGTVIPTFGIGAINGALTANALFGKSLRAKILGGLLGGGIHAGANALASELPLLNTVMGVANPILGGIAGYNLANATVNQAYANQQKQYNDMARQNAKIKSELPKPVKRNLFRLMHD